MKYQLSNKKKFIDVGNQNWSAFLENRKDRLRQINRINTASEKITENILEDLFTKVLDWSLSDLNNQIKRCDVGITKMGIKYLLIEAKSPNSFSNKSNISKAIQQVIRYAREQKVKKIAISDGYRLILGDLCENFTNIVNSIQIFLDEDVFPEDLWFLSMHGIYRPVPKRESTDPITTDELLHPKYKIPARCFGYVGDSNNTKTWKLPYLLLNGEVDTKRISKAIGSVISNYRGSKVKNIPENETPAILKKFEIAARSIRMMPDQNCKTTKTYILLRDVLVQFE